MNKEIYKPENNLFQSDRWLDFQKQLGRETITQGSFSGISLGLPGGKNFIWFQKTAPTMPIKQEKATIFIRIEPDKITESEIKRLGLKKVVPGSLLSGQASPKATRVLDINISEEEILAQMKPKTRYNIRLAKKRGVEVKEETDSKVLYAMLRATSARNKGFSPHEQNYYEKMMEILGPVGLVKNYTAYHGDEPLASILVSFYGKTAIYLHGGFTESKRNLMAPYLCQWKAIQDAKGKGCEYYDFWGIAESDDPNDSWAGISRFKEGFGGERIIFPGSYDYVYSSFWYNAFTLLAKVNRIFK